MRDKQKHNFGADEREADLLRDAEHDNADDALYKVPAQPATFPHCPYVPRATPCTPPPLPSPERRSSPPLPLAEPTPSRSRARLPPDADMTRTQPSHCPPPPFTPSPPLKPPTRRSGQRSRTQSLRSGRWLMTPRCFHSSRCRLHPLHTPHHAPSIPPPTPINPHPTPARPTPTRPPTLPHTRP